MKPVEVYKLSCEVESDLREALQELWDRRISIVYTIEKVDKIRRKAADLSFEIAALLSKNES
jgi:hypothetical protein